MCSRQLNDTYRLTCRGCGTGENNRLPATRGRRGGRDCTGHWRSNEELIKVADRRERSTGRDAARQSRLPQFCGAAILIPAETNIVHTQKSL